MAEVQSRKEAVEGAYWSSPEKSERCDMLRDAFTVKGMELVLDEIENGDFTDE